MTNALPRLLVASIFVLLAGFSQTRAQDPLNREWLEKDLLNLEVLAQLMPVEQKTEGQISQLFKRANSREQLGFGAHRIQFDAPGAYTSLTLSILYFDGAVAQYRLSVSSNSERWPTIQDEIIAAWKKNGGPEFQDNGHGLMHQRVFTDVLEKYKQRIAGELGPMHSVTGLGSLAGDYEYLMSPFENSTVGFSGCGYGGVDPQGLTAIKRLVASGRVDLVENVLRGYNPGGRVYAAWQLLKLNRSDSGIAAIANKVLDLDLELETCSGCVVSYRKARDVLVEEK